MIIRRIVRTSRDVLDARNMDKWTFQCGSGDMKSFIGSPYKERQQFVSRTGNILIRYTIARSAKLEETNYLSYLFLH